MPETEPHPGARLSAGTLLASCLTVALSQIALAMPVTLNGKFQEDLHLVGSELTWISAAFLLPITVLELTFGVLGDMFGRKRVLVGGAVLMAAGQLLSATAGGFAQLLTGQIVAGVAAAAMFPVTLAMVAAGTHTRRERARGVAGWGAAMAAGGLVAPLLGGLTATFGSFPLSFGVVAGLAVVAALVSAAFARDSRAPEGRSLDWIGQVTIVVGLSALLYGVIQGPGDGWTSPSVVAAFALAAVLLAFFVRTESRTRSPLLRLALFRDRDFAVASIVSVIGMFAFLGIAYATSIRISAIQHLSPALTAIPFIVPNAIMMALTPLTARLLERVNPRIVLSGGFALIALGGCWMAAIDIHVVSVAPLLAPQVLVGVGFALALSSITAVAVNTVPVQLAGMASGAISMLRDLGLTLGPAIIGAVALDRAATLFGAGLAASALPEPVKAAAAAVAADGGPLAVNALPPDSPAGQAADLAMTALGSGYSLGYLVCGVAAAASAVLAALALRGTGGPVVATQPAPSYDVAQPNGRKVVTAGGLDS